MGTWALLWAADSAQRAGRTSSRGWLLHAISLNATHTLASYSRITTCLRSLTGSVRLTARPREQVCLWFVWVIRHDQSPR